MCSTPLRQSSRLSELSCIKKKETKVDAIDVINKLQNKLTSKGRLLEVPLPQIVVQGEQSSGKTGVLEGIVGRDFLPRGTGTVTRRPTVIQLHPSNEVYAEFLHRGNEKFTDFERVKQEIREETMRDPGPHGYSSKPITLKIFSPNVLKLTLVDMPGSFKNPTPNMPKDSKKDVEKMILQYIEQPNCIILAVTPANQDIMTSDALEMARKVDPKYERTLCVLTKLDLMDRGTDAKDILENEVLPLTKGYVGVVNRSQQDIDDGKDFQVSLQSEKEFFEDHPAYSHMADRQGSSYLHKRLHFELIEHIRKTLPSIRKDLSYKLSLYRKDLKQMDRMMDFKNGRANGPEIFMLKLVHQFIDDIHTSLYGHSEHVCRDSLKAGFIINYKAHSELEEILKLPTGLAVHELMNILGNVHGTRNILSIPSVTLEAAFNSILKQYKEPVEMFVDSISSILISAVEDSCRSTIIEYPALKEDVVRLINVSIDKASEETKDLLGKHIDSQMGCCNLYHWDFSKSKWEHGLAYSPVILWNPKPDRNEAEGSNSQIDENKNSDITDSSDDSEADENETKESSSQEDDQGNVDSTSDARSRADDLNSLSEMISEKMKRNEKMNENVKNLLEIITEYMHLVQKQVADATLKYIYRFLVNQVFDFIKTELMIKLLNSSTKEKIVEECEQEFERRNDLLNVCADLEEALVAVQSF